MSAASNYLEDEIIKHIFRTGSFTKPTTLAVALLTAASDDTGTGTFSTGTGTEVSNSNNYGRKAHNPLDANWDAPSGGTSNTTAITFNVPSGSWGTITHDAICDSATYDAGNMLFHGALDTSKAPGNGDTVEYAAGALDITIN